MSTAYQVDLVFGTRQVDTQLGRLEQRLRQVDRTADRAGRDSFQGLTRGAEKAQSTIESMVGSLRAFAALGIATTALAAGRAIFTLGAQAEATQVRIRGLTRGMDDYGRFQEVARASAQRFGLSQQAAADGLATTYARLRPLGFTLTEIRDVYEGFNTAARNSGATAAESEGAFRQLAQALGSGALRGDEFNSIMEQTPIIGIEVAKVLGINASELRKMAAEGKLTGDVVLKALQNIRTEGADQLTKSLNTGGSAVDRLKAKFSDLGAEVGKKAMPPIITTLEAVNTLLDIGIKNAEGLKIGLIEAIKLAGSPALSGTMRLIDFLQRTPIGRDLLGQFGATFGYRDQADQMGPFLPEGLESRNRREQQAARDRAAAAEKQRKERDAAFSGGGALQELLRRIRSGEGSYTSINRGRAGDTPGGMPGLTSMSVGQVMAMQQAGRAFAVGAYQFVPGTLRGAVSRSGISPSERFSPAIQDRLATELILGGAKRPGLSAYLTGRSNSLNQALNEISSEWAAVTGANGRGRYDGDSAGNRASISVKDLLPLVRREVMGGGGIVDDLAQGQFTAAQRAEEERRQRQERLESSREGLRLSEAELAIARASTPLERLRAEYAKDREAIIQRATEAGQEALTDDERNNVVLTMGNQLRALQADFDREALAISRQQNAELLRRLGLTGEIYDLSRISGSGRNAPRGFDLKGTLADTSEPEQKVNRLEQAIDTVSDAYGGFLRDVISGTSSAEDALAGLFRGIADSFADMVADMLAEWAKAQLLGLFMPKASVGGGGGLFGATSDGLFQQGLGIAGSMLSFDGGGRTPSGSRTGGVDGRGGFPAILHPNETVIDHTQGGVVAGGAVNSVVNVTIASDGSAKVDASQATGLGREVEAAVVAVLAKQRRPGGMLAGGR